MANKQTAQVVDDIFTYTTKAGLLIEIDLDIPAEVFEQAMSDEAETEAQQFDAIKAWLPQGTQDAFDKMGGLERARFFRTFFTAFQTAAAMPLGESFSSLDSSGSTEKN